MLEDKAESPWKKVVEALFGDVLVVVVDKNYYTTEEYDDNDYYTANNTQVELGITVGTVDLKHTISYQDEYWPEDNEFEDKHFSRLAKAIEEQVKGSDYELSYQANEDAFIEGAIRYISGLVDKQVEEKV